VRIDKHELGAIIKNARIERGLTQESLAEKVDIGARHLMSIENEGRAPSFRVLYGLIRELNISADTIFYPEKPSEDLMLNEIIRILKDCDERSLKIVHATVRAALDSQTEDCREVND